MSTYAIQAGALRTNPNSGPDGVGVQADIAYTLEARAEVQAVCAIGTPANDNSHPGPATGEAGEPLRFLSVCSGIEAASVAWKPLGWQAVAFSEIEKFPSAVLAHHYPDVPNLGDFTQIDTTTLGQVDILCGGTPCQAFSVAGLRQSLDDARGNLSLEFVRLAHELADGNGLRNVVWENVVGVLSTKDNAFGCFLAGLVGADTPIEPPTRGKWGSAGLVSGPKGRAAWRIVDAQYFGVAQRRRRVLVVADFGNGADPAQVLFELEGVQRHTAPSREAGKGFTHTTAGSARDCGEWPASLASTLNAAFGEKLGLENQHINSGAPLFVPHAVSVTGDIAHTLKAEGADASEDGTGRGTPIVSYAQTVAIRGREGGATAELGGEVATALRASSGGGDKPHVLAAVGADVFNGALTGDLAATMGTRGSSTNASGPTVLTSAVRRLTPTECERLQGFPDDYTAIPWRGKPASECPDGPRYKALGNSWAVPKFVWLGRRIAMHMPVVLPSALPAAATTLQKAA